MSLRILRAGIDTLEVSFCGDVTEQVAEELDMAKSAALVTPQPYYVGMTEMMVQGKAYGFWRWRLVSPEFSIVMKKGGAVGGVTAQVRFSAWGLANRAPDDLWALARMNIKCLGDFKELSVARCDVCADFQGWMPTPSDLAGMVCPAAYRATHGTEKAVQTFMYGKGDVVVRVYNKTEELKVSGKEWLRGLWVQSDDYNPAEAVFRVEVQLRRKALHELGYNTVAAVIENPGALLDYGLSWCNLRIPTGDTTKTRWPEDPRWTALRKSVFDGVPLGRSVVPSSVMNLDQVKSRLVGLVATAGVYFGTTDWMKTLQLMSMVAEVHMMDEGIDFAARVEEKRRRILAGDQ